MLPSIKLCLYYTDDQAAVRVTNLSEDANENDLRDLFGPFGAIQRVFLAKDKRTQQSKVCLEELMLIKLIHDYTVTQ